MFVFVLQMCNPSVQGCGEVNYGLSVILMLNLSMFVFVLQRCNPSVSYGRYSLSAPKFCGTKAVHSSSYFT